MKPEHIARRERAAADYLRHRKRRRAFFLCTFIVLAASVIGANAGLFGRVGDDWSRFDHKTVRIIFAPSGDSLAISDSSNRIETVSLIGVVAPPQRYDWLAAHAVGREGIVLLQTPQTRDVQNRLMAYVFIDNQNLSVEMVRAGMAYADRRTKCEMDGLIEPAEVEARKKKRGMWADLKFDQMPQWRQDWLKALPRRKAIGH